MFTSTVLKTETLKIYEACKNAGLPEPTITSLDGGILVVLYKDTSPVQGGAISGAIGGAILTDRQKEVLDILKANKKISYRAIAIQLNINESAVLKHIDLLKEKGIIKRIGGTRGYWEIKN